MIFFYSWVAIPGFPSLDLNLQPIDQFTCKMIPSSRYPLLLVGGIPVGYFTSMAKDLNSGPQRTNPAGGHGRTWTRSLRITSPVPWPLDYTISYSGLVCIKSHQNTIVACIPCCLTLGKLQSLVFLRAFRTESQYFHLCSYCFGLEKQHHDHSVLESGLLLD